MEAVGKTTGQVEGCMKEMEKLRQVVKEEVESVKESVDMVEQEAKSLKWVIPGNWSEDVERRLSDVGERKFGTTPTSWQYEISVKSCGQDSDRFFEQDSHQFFDHYSGLTSERLLAHSSGMEIGLGGKIGYGVRKDPDPKIWNDEPFCILQIQLVASKEASPWPSPYLAAMLSEPAFPRLDNKPSESNLASLAELERKQGFPGYIGPFEKRPTAGSVARPRQAAVLSQQVISQPQQAEMLRQQTVSQPQQTAALPQQAAALRQRSGWRRLFSGKKD
ncbi:hypothetical protein DL765_000748 [Monosporascus sp. GIB2]|nr:hypothetical protein DL765_000748 [Monosporascus sp. GIB2]